MKRLVAVEVTPEFVRGVEVEGPLTTNPKIVAFGETPLAAGVAGDSEVFDQSLLKAALGELWRESKFSTRQVVLGIGGRKVLNRDFDTPATDLEKIRSKLKFETANILPPQMTEALLDFYPTEVRRANTGIDTVHGLLIAAPQQMVEVLVDTVQASGLSVVAVDYSPFGLARVARKAFGVSGEYLLVNVRPASTDIIALKYGVPKLVRVIPNGLQMRSQIRGRHIDDENDTTFEADGRNKVAPIDSLISGVRNTASFYANKGGAPTAILLAGEGSLSPELQERLPQEAQLAAGLLSMSDVFPNKAADFTDDPLQLAAAIGVLGLGLRGLKD